MKGKLLGAAIELTEAASWAGADADAVADAGARPEGTISESCAVSPEEVRVPLEAL